MTTPPEDLTLYDGDGTADRRDLTAYLCGWDQVSDGRAFVSVELGGYRATAAYITLTPAQAQQLRDWLTAALAHMETP